jgi:pilus assembly protein CpaB
MRFSKYAYVAASLLAVLAGIVVYLYQSTADDRMAAGKSAVAVMVASANIERGLTLADATARHLIGVEHFPRAALPSDVVLAKSHAGRFTVPSGRVFYRSVPAGQLIRSSVFVKPVGEDSLVVPDDSVAITINLDDAARVAGYAVPGSQVAIFFGKAQSPETRVLVPSVRILAVGNQSAGLAPSLVTVAVSPSDAARILVAERSGVIKLALLGKDSLR